MGPWRSSEGTARPAVPLGPDRMPPLRVNVCRWIGVFSTPGAGALRAGLGKVMERHEARW